MNGALLALFAQRLSEWGAKATTEGLLFASIFKKFHSAFKHYSEFSTQYDKALKLYRSLLESEDLKAELSALNASIPETIGEWKNVPRNLESFLITPIQRFPRYQLLLDGILKKSEEEHPDKAELVEALDSVTELAFYFNNLSRMTELIAEDDAYAVLQKEKRVVAGRYSVLLADITDPQKTRKAELVLCNDILVDLTALKKGKSVGEASVPLTVVWLPKEAVTVNTHWAFQLVSPEPSWLVCLPDHDSADKLLRQLTELVGKSLAGYWTGATSTDLPHMRKEQYLFADGTQYEGGWNFGKFHGAGRLTKPDGTEYRAHFDSKLRAGIGVRVRRREEAPVSFRMEGREVVELPARSTDDDLFGKDLTAHDWHLVQTSGTRLEYAPGAVLIEQGIMNTNLYTIVSGEVEVVLLSAQTNPLERLLAALEGAVAAQWETRDGSKIVAISESLKAEVGLEYIQHVLDALEQSKVCMAAAKTRKRDEFDTAFTRLKTLSGAIRQAVQPDRNAPPEKVLSTLGAGTLLGEMSMLQRSATSVQIRAQTAVTLLRIEMSFLRDLFKSNAGLSARFFHRIALKLAEQLAQLHSTARVLQVGLTEKNLLDKSEPRKLKESKESKSSHRRRGSTTPIPLSKSELDEQIHKQFELDEAEVFLQHFLGCKIATKDGKKYKGITFVATNHVCFEGNKTFGKNVFLKWPLTSLEAYDRTETAIALLRPGVYAVAATITFKEESDAVKMAEILDTLLGQKSAQNKDASAAEKVWEENKTVDGTAYWYSVQNGIAVWERPKEGRIVVREAGERGGETVSTEDWNTILRHGTVTTVYAPGAHLVREGELHGKIFHISEGQCQILKEERVLATMGQGEMFGEVSYLKDSPATASVVAEGKVECQIIDSEFLKILFMVQPELAGPWFSHLATILANRVKKREFEIRATERNPATSPLLHRNLNKRDAKDTVK